MRARRHRLAASQATFPNLAIYRRSVAADNRAIAQRRQVIFPHRRRKSRRVSSSSLRDRPTSSSSNRNRQTSNRSWQSRELRLQRQSRHVRRLTAQQKLIHSRASLRRNISTNTRSQRSYSPREARVLDDFRQGLQQHLRIAEANPNSRPRIPNVAQTVGSTHTLLSLVAFREEFKAAGLAVTSKDQKGERSKRPSQRKSMPPKFRAQNSRAAGAALSARRPGIVAASGISPPRVNYSSMLGASTLAVPRGVKVKSPRSVSPLAQGGHPLIAVRSSIDQGSTPMKKGKIPILREKPLVRAASLTKKLPWLKKNELPSGPDPLPAFRPPYPADSPSRATNNSSVTTIIDFSSHPSELWNRQELDFNDFQSRHPGLLMDRNKPPGLHDDIIMLENEIKQHPQKQPEVHPEVKTIAQSQGQVIIHDKSGPPKPLRIEVSEGPSFQAHGGSGHRAPPPLQTQLFLDNIDIDVPDLVRADSFGIYKGDKNPSPRHALPTFPDFSSFISGSSSDPSRRWLFLHRPKSAGDENGMDRPIYGRRASKEDISEEKRGRSREEAARKGRAQRQYDERRNEMPRTKFEIEQVTPWELPSDSTDTGDVRDKGKGNVKEGNDKHIQSEIIGTKREPSQEKEQMDRSSTGRKGIFGLGKLKDIRTRLRGLFGSNIESRSSTKDEPSQPSNSGLKAPESTDSTKRRQEKEKRRVQVKPTIVVPECKECQNRHPGSLTSGRLASLNEPRSARSFQEWQAGVPFKPPSRELSVNQHAQEEILACGHPKRKLIGVGMGLRDPVKRKVAARRTNGGRSLIRSRIWWSRAPSIFTIQESVPKTAPRISPPLALTGTGTKKEVSVVSDSGSDSGSDISDREVLKGLGIMMEGVVNEDVQAWIKEATGKNVRRFLRDLAKLDKLGMEELADKARRNMSKRKNMGMLGSHKKRRSEGSVL